MFNSVVDGDSDIELGVRSEIQEGMQNSEKAVMRKHQE